MFPIIVLIILIFMIEYAYTWLLLAIVLIPPPMKAKSLSLEQIIRNKSGICMQLLKECNMQRTNSWPYIKAKTFFYLREQKKKKVDWKNEEE